MPFIRLLLCSLLWWLALAPASAVQVRIATYNVLTGIGASDDMTRTALELVLARINADILCLQEVTSADLNDGHLDDLASNLGYGFGFVPVTALDTGSRVVILSKFPFVAGSTTSIISPPGANDMTRAAAAAIVDVPNTLNDPVIVTAHLKCCFDLDDPFRRAVEMGRIRNYLESLNVTGQDNVFVMGDFNLLGNDFTYSAIPTGLPQSYQLGSDVTFDVQYYANPTDYFTGLGIVNPGYFQQDGTTTDTFMGSDTILDYLLVSNSIASRAPSTEIYNSTLESSFAGLSKSGTPLASTTSFQASDHYPVYGDFELDDGLPLGLAISPTILDEGASPATVTITLPAPAPAGTILTLLSNDPGEALLPENTLTVPTGATSVTTTLLPLFDRITDSPQSVEIQVNGPGYQGTLANVTIRDADPQIYLLEQFNTAVFENFENFPGTQSLAAWEDGGIPWIGNDDGSSNVTGGRSYQGALGFLTDEALTFQTTLRNDSGQIIPALEVSYLAGHWRRITGGSADRIEVSVIQNGIATRVSDLDFTPSTTGAEGSLSPPEFSQKSTYLRAIDIAPGEDIQLLFRAIPGPASSTSSDDVFINEIHYNNSGADVDEFIEVLAGADFATNLSEVTIHLYNGSNGLSYAPPQSLATFVEAPPTGPGEPRLFSKLIPGIQNGSPDGIALAIGGNVREFISYGGAFTAVDGIAAGLVSTPIGVAQNGSSAVGENSIARTGEGGRAEDFTWSIQPGPHTPGVINVGQTIGTSSQPQGISIDNLSVTPLLDSDGDGLPDLEEAALGTNPNLADSDLDGQSDFFEAILTGTDPLASSSFFKAHLLLRPTVAEVSFPSLIGRTYRVETSTDLVTWITSSEQAGTGSDLVFEIDRSDTLFFRVGITRP